MLVSKIRQREGQGLYSALTGLRMMVNKSKKKVMASSMREEEDAEPVTSTLSFL